MFWFQKKAEKPNYWKIIGITLGILAAVAAVVAVVLAILKKNRDDAEYCDCCDCDDYCLDDDFSDEIEVEEVDDTVAE